MIEPAEPKAVLRPRIHPSVFIAEGARIYGDVDIGKGSSVWFNAVIRGDEGKISIGENTNIQDNVVVHSDDGAATTIGDDVTIGHGAVIRGCTIGSNVMIGMNATVMSHAVIGDNAVIGANALVPYHKSIAADMLAVGIPVKILRKADHSERSFAKLAVRIYVELIQRYKDKLILGLDKNGNR